MATKKEDEDLEDPRYVPFDPFETPKLKPQPVAPVDKPKSDERTKMLFNSIRKAIGLSEIK